MCNGQNQQPFLLFSREGSGNGEKLQQYIQKNPKPVLTPGYAMDYNLLADGDLAIGLYHPLDSIKQKTMLLALMLIAAFFLFVSLGAVIIRMITRNITLQLDLLYQKINAYFKEENPHVDNPHR